MGYFFGNIQSSGREIASVHISYITHTHTRIRYFNYCPPFYLCQNFSFRLPFGPVHHTRRYFGFSPTYFRW